MEKGKKVKKRMVRKTEINGRVDLYHLDHKIKLALQRVKNDRQLTKGNKKKIREFYDYLLSEDLSKGRVGSLIDKARYIGVMLGKDYEEATEEDIRKMVAELSNRNYSEHTKSQMKVGIKQIWKWLRKTEDYPKEVSWIKSGVRNYRLKMPEELYTEEDILQLISKGCNNPMQKCLVAVLYETGGRVGEVCNIRMKHIRIDNGEGFVRLEGKTGTRENFVKFSIPYIKGWLSCHLGRGDPTTPLFVNRSGEQLTYSGVYHLLTYIFERAGLNKKFNPHMFRHSRASFLADNGFSEQQLCAVFGWRLGSIMPRIYCHMSNGATFDRMRKLYGLPTKDKIEESKLQPKKCEICGHLNEVGVETCIKCSNPLTLKKALEKKDSVGEAEKENKTLTEMVKILAEQVNEMRKENKEIKDMFTRGQLEQIIAVRGKTE